MLDPVKLLCAHVYCKKTHLKPTWLWCGRVGWSSSKFTGTWRCGCAWNINRHERAQPPVRTEPVIITRGTLKHFIHSTVSIVIRSKLPGLIRFPDSVSILTRSSKLRYFLGDKVSHLRRITGPWHLCFKMWCVCTLWDVNGSGEFFQLDLYWFKALLKTQRSVIYLKWKRQFKSRSIQSGIWYIQKHIGISKHIKRMIIKESASFLILFLYCMTLTHGK